MAVATHRHPSRRTAFRSVLGAASLAALSLPLMLVGTAQAQAPQPVTALPSVPTAVEPGAGTIPAPDGTVWTDVDGDPIKAHGGSVVRVEESVVGLDITGDGTTEDEVYLWYGEDKTNATRPVDGVRGYWSTDLVDWHDMGRVLPSHQHFTLRVNAEGTAVEVDPERVEEIKQTANLTAPTGDVTQDEIDAARDFVEPYVTAWADEEAGIAAEYDEANLANASYRLNGNINIMERPKMLYNELTGKFVIIYHADGPLPDNPDLVEWVRDGGRRENQNVGSRYSRAEVGFAVSDTPWGPFRLVNTTKLNWADGVPNPGREGDSRDMTVFQDAGTRTVDPGADDAYVVYSSEMNKWMYISRLNAEYTGPLAEGNEAVLGQDFSNRVLPDFSREASAVLKYDGYYYMLTSGTDGWASTPVVAYRSPAMITDTEAVIGNNNGHPTTGQWERLEIVNPCIGVSDRAGVGTADPSRCFDSQPTFAITLDQEAGQYIYMGDRWITEANGSAGERSRYVWAPIQVDADTRQVTIENVGSWSPGNASLYAPLEPTEPLVFPAELEDRASFAPTIDVTVAGRTYTDVSVAWTQESLDAAFTADGTHRIEGHVTGTGANTDLDGRYVEATVVIGGVLDACLLPDTSVSGSFHQTVYGNFPANLACDGDESTSWSTWASSNGYPDAVTFTAQFGYPWGVDEITLRNIEGNPAGVTVEYRDPASGEWTATSAGTTALAATGTVTTVEFDRVTTTGLRLQFDTPGTYLKITEITIPVTQPGTFRQAETVTVASPAGEQPALPTTVAFAMDGAEYQLPVTWQLDGYGFTSPYQPYRITGTTEVGVTARATVHTVPADTVYFVDSGSAQGESPVFDAVAELRGAELLHEASDAEFTAETGWGYVPQAGTDGPVIRPEGSQREAIEDVYERILASRTASLDYRLTFPEAGRYTVTARVHELWGGQNRHQQVQFTDPAGLTTDVGEQIDLTGQGHRVQVSGIVEVSEPGVATLSVVRPGASGTMPLLSWFAVAAGEVDVETVAVAAPSFDPTPQTVYGLPQDVRIESATPGAEIYYTLDGTEPTRATGTRYEGAILIEESTTVRAISWHDGLASEVVEAAYTIVDHDGEYTSVPVGAPWFDTDGRLIQAHGGGFLVEHDENGDPWYYWVGENKEHHRSTFLSVNLYRSRDLLNWEFVKQILTEESATGEESDRLETNGVKVERPKLLYNDRTGKYVLWGHWETADSYTASRLVVATSDTIDGLYEYVDDFRPGEGEVWDLEQEQAIHSTVENGTYPDFAAAETAYREAGNEPRGHQSRDFTVYQDPDSEQAYLISAEAHHHLRIYPLSEDYLTADHVNSYTILEGESREATAIVKIEGTYYLLSSGQSGWYPNQLLYNTTTDLSSPDGWSESTLIGNNTTFKSQPTYIMEVPKRDGSGESSYVYMGDRWTPTGGLGNSTYVWLPLELDDEQLSLSFTDGWMLDVDAGEIVVPPLELVSQGKSASASPGAVSQNINTGYRDADGEQIYSGYTAAEILANPAAAANDGIDYTAGRFDNTHYYVPQPAGPYHWQVDLEEPTDLARVDIAWRQHNGSETYSTYRLLGSQDGQDWELIADGTDNRETGFTSDRVSGEYRHVRLEVDEVINDHNGNSAFWAAGLVEVQVYAVADDDGPEPVLPDSVEISGRDSATVGETFSLSAAVLPKEADQAVMWSSSDESVATVDAAGLVTAVAPGEVTITATSIANDEVHASHQVGIQTEDQEGEPEQPESVEISGPDSVAVGETVTLSAAVLPQEADQAVTWSSSDELVATVDDTGTVTGLAAGEVTITAESMVDGAVLAEHRLNVLADSGEPGDGGRPGDDESGEGRPGGPADGDRPGDEPDEVPTGDGGAPGEDGADPDGALPAAGAAVASLFVLAVALAGVGVLLVRRRRA